MDSVAACDAGGSEVAVDVCKKKSKSGVSRQRLRKKSDSVRKYMGDEAEDDVEAGVDTASDGKDGVCTLETDAESEDVDEYEDDGWIVKDSEEESVGFNSDTEEGEKSVHPAVLLREKEDRDQEERQRRHFQHQQELYQAEREREAVEEERRLARERRQKAQKKELKDQKKRHKELLEVRKRRLEQRFQVMEAGTVTQKSAEKKKRSVSVPTTPEKRQRVETGSERQVDDVEWEDDDQGGSDSKQGDGQGDGQGDEGEDYTVGMKTGADASHRRSHTILTSNSSNDDVWIIRALNLSTIIEVLKSVKITDDEKVMVRVRPKHKSRSPQAMEQLGRESLLYEEVALMFKTIEGSASCAEAWYPAEWGYVVGKRKDLPLPPVFFVSHKDLLQVMNIASKTGPNLIMSRCELHGGSGLEVTSAGRLSKKGGKGKPGGGGGKKEVQDVAEAVNPYCLSQYASSHKLYFITKTENPRMYNRLNPQKIPYFHRMIMSPRFLLDLCEAMTGSCQSVSFSLRVPAELEAQGGTKRVQVMFLARAVTEQARDSICRQGGAFEMEVEEEKHALLEGRGCFKVKRARPLRKDELQGVQTSQEAGEKTWWTNHMDAGIVKKVLAHVARHVKTCVDSQTHKVEVTFRLLQLKYLNITVEAVYNGCPWTVQYLLTGNFQSGSK